MTVEGITSQDLMDNALNTLCFKRLNLGAELEYSSDVLNLVDCTHN